MGRLNGFWVSLLILSLVSCSKTPDKAIELVLNECAKKSVEVNQSTMSAAQSASYLADSMQRIDVRECPADFRVAFQDHINAWRTASGYLAQDTPLNAVLEGFTAGILGDSSLLAESQRNSAQALSKVNITYERLTLIATAYGARVPISVVEK